MQKDGGIIGVSDHGGWAVLVTIGGDGKLLDRRRVELVDDDLPALPHHHPRRGSSLEEAVGMVERVRRCAQTYATRALDAVALDVRPILGIALRTRPELPATVADRITDHRARNVADWVMYRTALASAAEARGWPVFWYDPKKVEAEAADALRVDNFYAYFLGMRNAVGPPWNADHRRAMAAAIVAARRSVD